MPPLTDVEFLSLTDGTPIRLHSEAGFLHVGRGFVAATTNASDLLSTLFTLHRTSHPTGFTEVVVGSSCLGTASTSPSQSECRGSYSYFIRSILTETELHFSGMPPWTPYRLLVKRKERRGNPLDGFVVCFDPQQQRNQFRLFSPAIQRYVVLMDDGSYGATRKFIRATVFQAGVAPMRPVDGPDRQVALSDHERRRSLASAFLPQPTVANDSPEAQLVRRSSAHSPPGWWRWHYFDVRIAPHQQPNTMPANDPFPSSDAYAPSTAPPPLDSHPVAPARSSGLSSLEGTKTSTSSSGSSNTLGPFDFSGSSQPQQPPSEAMEIQLQDSLTSTVEDWRNSLSPRVGLGELQTTSLTTDEDNAEDDQTPEALSSPPAAPTTLDTPWSITLIQGVTNFEDGQVMRTVYSEGLDLDFSIPEGAVEVETLTFLVHKPVKGLQRKMNTYRAGLHVKTDTYDLGNYIPRKEPYQFVFPTAIVPTGFFVRAKYTQDVEYVDETGEKVFPLVRSIFEITKKGIPISISQSKRNAE